MKHLTAIRIPNGVTSAGTTGTNHRVANDCGVILIFIYERTTNGAVRSEFISIRNGSTRAEVNSSKVKQNAIVV
jgi:hypothetical protein